jgi:hypothetical protein
MKITGIEAAAVNLPADEPLASAVVRPGAVRPTVLLEVHTDEGLQGIGFTFLGASLTPALLRAVEVLGEMCVGEDPLSITSVRRKLETAASGAGPAGIFTLALAAIDIALWDIKGKALGLPLWLLLGGSGESVPTYASGAMMREIPLERAVEAAGKLVDSGFREMKMQLALGTGSSPSAEVERARLIRERIGPDTRLMCDINQRWRPDEAIAIGRRLEEIGFFWLEDIIAPDDYAGMARVAVGAGDTASGRGVCLRPVAVPKHARGRVGRRRHDRSVPCGRHYAVAQDRGPGGGVQSSRGEPPCPGGASASHRRDPERADGGVHALVDCALRGSSLAGAGHARDAARSGPRSAPRPHRGAALPRVS